jgi:hypothetical protein
LKAILNETGPNTFKPEEQATEPEEQEPEMVAVGDFLVEKDVFTLRFSCDFASTQGICCQFGCWIKPHERRRIERVIKDVAEYLRDRPELPFWGKRTGRWVFVDPKMEDDEYHTQVINDRCIFSMTSGACAIHAYCLDNDIPWEDFKFGICVTWPLDIQLSDMDDGSGECWHIWLFNELHDEAWDECPCIRKDPGDSSLPLAIESQKSTIVSRIGPVRYVQLLAEARRWRENAESP